MSHAVLILLAALAITPGPAQPQGQSGPRPSRLGHGPDSIPDLSSHLIVVYGLQPLNDSASAVLRRRGLRVADRSPGTIEKAQREKRRLDAASFGILVETRYDSVARAPILIASLLDIRTTSRLRMTSVLFPLRSAWGAAMETVLTQLLAPPIRH